MSTWTLIDTETDGLYRPIHIIDIAAQKFDGLTPVGEPFQIFIDHGITISPVATAVHGYTTEFIAQNGVPPSEAYQKLRRYVESDPIAAHYLPFDWNQALLPELLRLGEESIGNRGFCSCMLSRRALPEHATHKLDYLREHYDLACCRPHSALGDVQTTTDLLTRVVFPRLKSIGYDSVDRVREFASLPMLVCKCLVQGLDYEEARSRVDAIRKEAQRARNQERTKQRLIDEFVMEVESGQRDVPELIAEFEMIDENPSIEFEGRTFLFTGKMASFTRPHAAGLIQQRGGSVSESKTVNSSVDYLVLGEDREKGWTSLIVGGKLTKAFLKRFKDPDSNYRIIREESFVTALNAG